MLICNWKFLFSEHICWLTITLIICNLETSSHNTCAPCHATKRTTTSWPVVNTLDSMPPGTPYHSFVAPYPIRVDDFSDSKSPGMSTPALYLLSHTHSDHVTG